MKKNINLIDLNLPAPIDHDCVLVLIFGSHLDTSLDKLEDLDTGIIKKIEGSGERLM